MTQAQKNLYQKYLAPWSLIFGPPFNGLWLLVLIYFVWTYFTIPASQTVRGNLPDPDDYMYLVQVLDWLKGQNWFDNIQQRLDPPTGVPIHFSRIAEMPMALLIRFFEGLGLKPRGAATIMALIWPIILFAGLLLTLRWVALAFLPKNWAGVTAFVALFTNEMTLLFAPGHVDHHGLIVLLMALMLGSIARLFETNQGRRYALMTGGLMALQMVIALEVLPWLVIVTSWIGLWAIVKGRTAGINALIYALVLWIGSGFGLLVTRPMATILDQDVLTYSIVYFYLTTGIVISFLGIALTSRFHVSIRFIIGGGAALVSGALFLHSFPELMAGPYGGMDAALSKIILNEMMEAKPLIGNGGTFVEFMTYMGGPLVALFASYYLVKNYPEFRQWFFGLIILLLYVGIILSVFYQRRFLGVTGLVTILPLSVLLKNGWDKIKLCCVGRGKVFAEIGLLLLVGPLPNVLFPAILDGRSLNKGVLLFPAQGSIGNICDMYKLENALRDPAVYGDRPRLIMNVIGTGPELLFRTPHRVLSAPFHMDVSGNLDATRFFSTPYPQEAEAIARRRGVELVIACRFVPDLYMRSGLDQTLNDAKLPKDIAPHLIEHLMTGKVPPWLKRSSVKDLDNFIIYEVVPSESTKGQNQP